jgi:hypothetical protein
MNSLSQHANSQFHGGTTQASALRVKCFRYSACSLKPIMRTKKQTTTNYKHMNTLKQLFTSSPRAVTTGTSLCVIALIALATSGIFGRASAAPHREDRDDDILAALYHNAQVAELYELQAAFHAAASHGGDIEAMMPLWADDGSLTVGTTVYRGKVALRNFFANISGAFKNNWVSLAPAFKTQIDVHGNKADIYFECHYADPSTTPYILKSDISATGTAKKVGGKWVLWNIVAGAAAL